MMLLEFAGQVSGRMRTLVQKNRPQRKNPSRSIQRKILNQISEKGITPQQKGLFPLDVEPVATTIYGGSHYLFVAKCR